MKGIYRAFASFMQREIDVGLLGWRYVRPRYILRRNWVACEASLVWAERQRQLCVAKLGCTSIIILYETFSALSLR